MPWTHFTSPLAPGEIMQAAKRDELLDAIEERFAAVVADTFAWAPEMDDIKSSGLISAKAAWTVNAGTPVVGSVADIVNVLSTYFIRGEAATDFVAPDVLGQAAVAEGYSTAEWGEIVSAVGAGVNVAAYWNVVKRAVGLLKRVSRPITSWQLANRGFISGPNFAAAAAALVVATPTFSTTPSFQTYLTCAIANPATSFSTTLTTRGQVAIPAMATGRIWLWSNRGTLANNRPLNVGLRVGGALGSVATTTNSTPVKVVVEAVPTGSQQVDWFFLGFENTAELSPLNTGPSTSSDCFQEPFTPIGIELQFVRE